jgi:hypothetical protein
MCKFGVYTDRLIKTTGTQKNKFLLYYTSMEDKIVGSLGFTVEGPGFGDVSVCTHAHIPKPGGSPREFPKNQIVGSRQFYIEKTGIRGSHTSNCGNPIWECLERQSSDIIEQKGQE